jgi:hypothetical protein
LASTPRLERDAGCGLVGLRHRAAVDEFDGADGDAGG